MSTARALPLKRGKYKGEQEIQYNYAFCNIKCGQTRAHSGSKLTWGEPGLIFVVWKGLMSKTKAFLTGFSWNLDYF